MDKIKIVTDSTADLPIEIIEKYDIEVVPLSIVIEGETYLDRVEIEPDEFIEKMEKTNDLPKSSQPPVGKFVELYEKLIKQGYKVISIHMTGGMSGTCQSAECAAKMVEGDITVFDSRFISKALSFQVVEAARLVKSGESKESVIKKIIDIRDSTFLFVAVDTLENLVKGGRIGKGKALLGSLLKLKPIASLQDGVYTPVAKVRSHSQVVKFLCEQFAEDVKGKTVKAVGIAHADALELADNLKKSLYEMMPELDVDISFTTPVISTHTGKGAIGFMYYTN
ncbi:DegV family protein [Metabacillus arenae]|uniref:DegV family protein n=1 Tax=Metabacillus arenae TaxID=2771434 RepID=A0A926NHB5_9BACI|nr:DegV family protein [Metabacillus arenae]MBD1381594.1 DegV family protein [Metabacillus arenae]